jgi:hypothetical protein
MAPGSYMRACRALLVAVAAAAAACTFPRPDFGDEDTGDAGDVPADDVQVDATADDGEGAHDPSIDDAVSDALPDMPEECEIQDDCDDLEPCNGVETCSSGGRCVAGEALDDGTACVTDTGFSGICRAGRCGPAECGDGLPGPGEECDDGAANSDTTPDACRTDCRLPSCGDGVTDSGEECDAESGFCSDDCYLQAPEGWESCTASDGSPVFLLAATWPGSHTWIDFRDHCKDLTDAESPVGYDFLGLAVLSDENVWECLLPLLSASYQYFIGLAQDRGATDYAEPDGGWYWTAWTGSAWENIESFDTSAWFLDNVLDDSGPSSIPPADCMRLEYETALLEFAGQDCDCDVAFFWRGVCMIQF